MDGRTRKGRKTALEMLGGTMPHSKYSPKQKRLAAVAPPRKKITGADLKKVGKGKKKKK